MVSHGTKAQVQHEAVDVSVSDAFYDETEVLRQIGSEYPKYWREVGWGGKCLYKIKEFKKILQIIEVGLQMFLHKEQSKESYQVVRSCSGTLPTP